VTGERPWAFLVDENLEPEVASMLSKEGYRAVHVQETLGKGAKDTPDVLPLARDEDLVVVTADVSDFGGLPPAEHRGVVLVYDQRLEPYRVANGVLDSAEAYGSREPFELDAVDNRL
jgi:hypothetical protein